MAVVVLVHPVVVLVHQVVVLAHQVVVLAHPVAEVTAEPAAIDQLDPNVPTDPAVRVQTVRPEAIRAEAAARVAKAALGQVPIGPVVLGPRALLVGARIGRRGRIGQVPVAQPGASELNGQVPLVQAVREPKSPAMTGQVGQAGQLVAVVRLAVAQLAVGQPISGVGRDRNERQTPAGPIACRKTQRPNRRYQKSLTSKSCRGKSMPKCAT